jgi:hypothetical protein
MDYVNVLHGVNLSNTQVARELDLNIHDVHDMLTAIRYAVCQKKPTPILKDNVEADEVYIVAGHKGNPALSKEARPQGAAS